MRLLSGFSTVVEHVRSGIGRLYERLFQPVAVTLEVTRHCQQSCLYCYRLPDSLSSEGYIDPVLLQTCLARLKQHFGAMYITLSGGEPLLHPNLPLLVRRCFEFAHSVKIISNLSALNLPLARELYQAGLRQVQTTFISPVPDEHDSLCGRGTFSSWLSGFHAAREAGLQTSAILLVTPQTVERIPIAIDFLLSLGVTSWMVNRYNAGYQTPNAAPSLFLNRGDLIRMLTLLEQTADKRSLKIPLGIPIPSCLATPSLFPHLEFPLCPMGKTGQYWAIGTDGNLRACNHLPIKLGNLQSQSVQEILEAPTWKNVLREMATKPVVCTNCQEFVHCQGGCRAAAHTWCGSLAECDPWVGSLLKK